jgi:hypothetical protein
MKVRFFADVNLSEDIVSGVLRREPSIRFLTAAAANLHGLPASQVLQTAADEGKYGSLAVARPCPTPLGTSSLTVFHRV